MASTAAMEALDLDGKAPGTEGQPAAEGAYSGLLDGLRQTPKQLPCSVVANRDSWWATSAASVATTHMGCSNGC